MKWFARDLPNFRGVFMKDDLPLQPYKNEFGILNLDLTSGSGTHWTAYYKRGSKTILYFDSFGDLQPPQELIHYLGSDIKYNKESYQSYNTFICGHLCLVFLYVCYNRI